MINLGATNTEKTVYWMFKMSESYKQNMYLKMLAKRLKGCNETETIKNIFNFCMDSLNYEPQQEQIIESPIYILSKGVSNCVNYSILIRTLCDILNIKCYFITVAYSEHIDSEHVFTVVLADNKSIIIDCVYCKIYKIKVINRTEMNHYNFKQFDYEA